MWNTTTTEIIIKLILTARTAKRMSARVTQAVDRDFQERMGEKRLTFAMHRIEPGMMGFIVYVGIVL